MKICLIGLLLGAGILDGFGGWLKLPANQSLPGELQIPAGDTAIYPQIRSDTLLNGHRVVLDGEGKIIPWYTPQEMAFDHFLHLRWNFIKNEVPYSPGPPPRSNYPQYYFYCAYIDENGELLPDQWMNDIGEKIPNWFESARLYYAYTGDRSVMDRMLQFIDYTLAHGTSSSDFAWPRFPYTTTNAGDTLFRGFTSAGRFELHEIQVDHAGEMGLTYFRMYQFTGNKNYLDAAIQVADVLCKYARPGNANHSVWPYRVLLSTGIETAPYGANWTGCYQLLDELFKAKQGDLENYSKVRDMVRVFLLDYPLKTGYWTDGHSDTDISSNSYKSNLSKSNFVLWLLDDLTMDPNWKQDIPGLIQWTEKHFVDRCWPGDPSTFFGANIVGEQDSFLVKMDYQTARYAAECARWYALSGDDSYREKAYRALSFVTYCNSPNGMAFESPFTKGINSWWSDEYGEGPKMFYHAFAAIPEWAPPRENHILYSPGVLKDVIYRDHRLEYTATGVEGREYLKLAFKPVRITLEGIQLDKFSSAPSGAGYLIREMESGDFAVTVYHHSPGKIIVE
ncbi:MAG: hypothetical protein R2806_17125 [Saprospiraceae bacterium]